MLSIPRGSARRHDLAHDGNEHHGADPKPKFRILSAVKSTIGCGCFKLRQMNAIPANPAIQAVAQMVVSLNRSQRSPSSSVYSRQPSDTAMRIVPP